MQYTVARKDGIRTMNEIINIKSIIETESIKIFFQPIISTYQEKIAGIEALVRGIHPDNRTLISPLALFEAAKEEGLVVELDHLCQKTAIRLFGERFSILSNLILFLNVDNSVIHLDSNTDAIYEYTKQYGVNPRNIVLEINELHSSSLETVIRFTKKYKDKGFMISIDDIGLGYSNLDRIILLKPDIIKLDRVLISNIHLHYYKQQVVDMMIRLSEKTGALIVAEGVEKIEEVLTVLQFGAHLLQGFYISKPIDLTISHIKHITPAITDIAQHQKSYLSSYLTNKCQVNINLRASFEIIKTKLENCCESDEENCLKKLLLDYTQVECAYLINDDGQQITDTIFNDYKDILYQKSLFSPYRRGDDATLRPYYYILKRVSQKLYVSDEFLSIATGNRCVTISGYCSINNQKIILCLDIIKNVDFALQILKDYAYVEKRITIQL